METQRRQKGGRLGRAMIISLGCETAGELGEYNITRWGLDGEGDDIG